MISRWGRERLKLQIVHFSGKLGGCIEIGFYGQNARIFWDGRRRKPPSFLTSPLETATDWNIRYKWEVSNRVNQERRNS